MSVQNNRMEGLSGKEAKKRLLQYGENKLRGGKKISPCVIFAGQFKDLLVIILLISTAISVLMGEYTEAIAIIAIVFVNAVLGFVQEYRTERTLEALKNMASPSANVIRDGKRMSVPATEVVPGDVVMIRAGDRVPADGRLFEAISLRMDESMLTGESVAVGKISASESEFTQPPPAGFNEKMVYMGTNVAKGKGKLVVTSTGMDTQMGQIAGMLSEIKEELTPLQKRLDQLGKYISIGCLVICAVVSVTGILRGEPVLAMLITGVSLAVAAVPEGLPAIVTIALALAVNRILKRNALVKHLHAVETLGCTTVICSDKTGTLTENKMTVRELYTHAYHVDVTGNGYEKGGEFLCDGRRVNVAVSNSLFTMAEISALCSNAQLTSDSPGFGGRDRSVNQSKGVWRVMGEPTEVALGVMAAKADVLAQRLDAVRLDELPFDSERKMMSVVVEDKNGKKRILTKGAPDLLLGKCSYILTDNGIIPMTPAYKNRIVEQNNSMAQRALRMIGFAYKELGSKKSPIESDLVFVGLAGMIDPPRKEAYDAVIKCKRARIRPVMITGDHKLTACAIAKDLHIMSEGDRVMTGAEIDQLSDGDFAAAVDKVTVFARVSPAHKLKIVRALKSRGEIVAMTGDGVNDAPAIKEANIGVSMGVGGTDVSKEASSLILLDDNFATLVAAIEEGRVIYKNIRKFIRYLLSCNIGEVVTMFVGMLMGLPVVLLPIQILLVNLATDGLPAIALGLEPAQEGIMSERPRSSKESVFSGGLLSTIIFRGCLIGITTLAVFVSFYGATNDLPTARTGALLTLVMTQLFHVFECKSETKSLFSIPLFDNMKLVLAVLVSAGVMAAAIYIPACQAIFSTVPLDHHQILKVLSYSLAVPVLTAVMQRLKQTAGQKQPRIEMSPEK